MKSGNRDKAEGQIHQGKGKLKETAGKLIGDRDLVAEGKAENAEGRLQEKVGEIKKIVGK